MLGLYFALPYRLIFSLIGNNEPTKCTFASVLHIRNPAEDGEDIPRLLQVRIEHVSVSPYPVEMTVR